MSLKVGQVFEFIALNSIHEWRSDSLITSKQKDALQVDGKLNICFLKWRWEDATEWIDKTLAKTNGKNQVFVPVDN